MRLATIDQIQKIEEKIIQSGTSASDLMEKAAQGVCDFILNDPLTSDASEFIVFAGKGNNGGDGIVVARLLLEKEKRVQLVFTSSDLGLLAKEKWQILKKKFPHFEAVTDAEKIQWVNRSGVVVDAILGIGVKSKPRGEVATWIRRMNEERWRRFFRMVAIDLPSGLCEETENAHDAVVADLTLTLGLPKRILAEEKFSNWVGRIGFVPLFSEAEKELSEHEQLILPQELAPLLPRRLTQSHKGTYGRALLMAGSLGMTGAAVLSASACIRTGAGLTTLATFTDSVSGVLTQMPPEVMVRDLFSGQLLDWIRESDAIGIGPGFGQTQEAHSALSYLLDHVKVPLVLDADALNLLAQNSGLISQVPENSILTPHPGEMQRLLKKETLPVLSEVIDFAERQKWIVIFKSARTAVVLPNRTVFWNSSGNAGLAKGGSGDVLTGMIVALLAQGLLPEDAAKLGVWLHGVAADQALRTIGEEESMIASDVISSIPQALRVLRK